MAVDASRLRNIELFAPLSDDQVGSLAQVAQEATFDEGAPLVKAGTWSYQLFALEEGAVRVERDGDTIATLQPGDVVGETGVVERALRNASVIATSPLRVIYFTQADIGRLSKSIPDLDERLNATLEERRKAQ